MEADTSGEGSIAGKVKAGANRLREFIHTVIPSSPASRTMRGGI